MPSLMWNYYSFLLFFLMWELWNSVSMGCHQRWFFLIWITLVSIFVYLNAVAVMTSGSTVPTEAVFAIYIYIWQLIFVWYHADAFVFLSVLFWVMTSFVAEHNSTTLQIWDWSFDSLVACKNSWYQYWGWREKVWSDSIRAGRV